MIFGLKKLKCYKNLVDFLWLNTYFQYEVIHTNYESYMFDINESTKASPILALMKTLLSKNIKIQRII